MRVIVPLQFEDIISVNELLPSERIPTVYACELVVFGESRKSILITTAMLCPLELYMFANPSEE